MQLPFIVSLTYCHFFAFKTYDSIEIVLCRLRCEKLYTNMQRTVAYKTHIVDFFLKIVPLGIIIIILLLILMVFLRLLPTYNLYSKELIKRWEICSIKCQIVG